jgi:outer membrane receptor protein involved in Fe transport
LDRNQTLNPAIQGFSFLSPVARDASRWMSTSVISRGGEGGSNDYAVSLYNLGTIYDFKNGHQVWINYGEGFDLPDPAKFYGKPGLSEATKPAPACRATTRLPSKTTLTTRSAAIPPSTC